MRKFFLFAAAAIAVSCGNKQQAQQSESDSTAVATESVAQQVDAQEDTQKVIDEIASEKIKEFYKNYVFGDKEATDKVINQYCTKKLAKKLADDYEYEGGGYAIWDFRSGSQDPDETKVLKVETLGDMKYKVVMDANVSCVITIVVNKEDIKIIDAEDIKFDAVDNTGK
jgi:ribosomal protein L17